MLVEDLPAITYIADFDEAFTLRYVSPQIEQILGISPVEWLIDDKSWVASLHPADRDRIVAEAEGCVAEERPMDFEYRIITPDGRTVWIWEKTSIVRDADGAAGRDQRHDARRHRAQAHAGGAAAGGRAPGRRACALRARAAAPGRRASP